MILFFSLSAVAQTWDDQFQRPLVEVIGELEEQYQVRIKHDKKTIGDFMLTYAEWRIVPGDLEQSLRNILVPFDYIYIKQAEGVYKIKPFQYHLISPEQGAQNLEYFKTLYSGKETWEKRKAELKNCMIEALGLKELPNVEKPKVILGKERKYENYSVQNIALETVPGLYVTGSIYRPAKKAKEYPLIISPNGHFGDGRYRKNEQLRCAALAKMGAIAVSYDLFGWGESALQVGSKSHRTSTAHTIQTNNAIKLIDYFIETKKIDPSRIGITGGSGGGSQTMLVSAIDERIAVSVPVVMTSSYHSGGCPCESGKPIHLCNGKTNNVEIASMIAPKPMLVVSDGRDWTQQVPEVEFPFIQRTYGFYEALDKVENAHFPEEGHDYGFSKRSAMYKFMSRHLKLNLNQILDNEGNINESDIIIETEEQMLSFGIDGENLPKDALKSFEELNQKLHP